MKFTVRTFSILVLLAIGCGGSSEAPEYLFVQTADQADLTDTGLVLLGVNPQTAWFTDRPVRESGQVRTAEFISLWDEGRNSFSDDPPNADLTCTLEGEVVSYVVELRSPRLLRPVVVPGDDDSDAGLDLLYEISFVGAASVDPQPPFRCDSAHLFIDGSACTGASTPVAVGEVPAFVETSQQAWELDLGCSN